ncbi:MAG: tetratricopeptide repeat protein [Burkholderiales bacterium]
MSPASTHAPAADGRVAIPDAMRQALALHQSGRLNDAERIYRAVLDAVPEHFEALHMLGILCAQTGHPGEGATLLRRAVDADPASAAAQANLANVMKQLGRHDAALTHVDRALVLDPANAGVHNIRAGLLLDLGRHDEALASCDAALAIAPDTAEAHYHRGVALQAKGRHDEALASYDRALGSAPGFVAAMNNRGNVLRALGRMDEAIASYDRAVAAAPGYALAWSNRAAALRALGRHADAVASCDRALASNANLVEAHVNRAAALGALGHHAEALASCDRALALQPGLAEVHGHRGLALLALGRGEDALAAFDRVLALRPDAPEAVYGRGAALHALRRHDEALASYDRALALDPNLIAAINGRADVLRQLGRRDEALAEWQRALALDPDLSEVHRNCGALLHEFGRYEEALASYDRALALRPDFVRALYNRIGTLAALARYDEALATSDRLLALDPDQAEAHHNRGCALSSLARFPEAVDAYTRALALDPRKTAALENRGSVLAYLQQHDDAARDFAQVLAVDPHFAYVRGALLKSRLHCGDWRDYDATVAQLAADAEAGQPVSEPFQMVTTTWSAPAQLACMRAWARDKVPAAATPLWTGERYAHDRIRVAYLSADLHEHATAFLLAGVFERHDRARFETIGVSFGPDTGDPMRARLRRSFDRFVDVRERSDRGIAELLRELEVDIAVDLKGYTYDSRPGIFAQRPAPVHVSYLGFPGTMGAPWMDYLLADETIVPAADTPWYSERIVRLPDSYQGNDDARAIAAATPSRADEGLPPSGFVFCSFNSTYKITPPVFDVWMRLLDAVPGSVLWLLEGNRVAPANLRREAQARGVAPERLVFAPRRKLPEHLARHRLADLFLDTLPVNAHTTASDALWAGLPVVTCLGTTFAGRVAGSLLRAAGLPELVVASLAEYEALALALARDAGSLAALRERLAAGRATCPLFATERFCRHLEAAYVAMWERAQRGEAPEAFAVPRLP